MKNDSNNESNFLAKPQRRKESKVIEQYIAMNRMNIKNVV
jgi:hypothetical protein